MLLMVAYAAMLSDDAVYFSPEDAGVEVFP